jgi:hypothetical protein
MGVRAIGKVHFERCIPATPSGDPARVFHANRIAARITSYLCRQPPTPMGLVEVCVGCRYGEDAAAATSYLHRQRRAVRCAVLNA